MFKKIYESGKIRHRAAKCRERNVGDPNRKSASSHLVASRHALEKYNLKNVDE